ncbi:hypothetical protein, partial [Ferrovum sp.]|uniref:hypothetical protein n=1 Tax=Ferrovum sp. TaxID=2609467 RepID=UPI00260A1066
SSNNECTTSNSVACCTMILPGNHGGLFIDVRNSIYHDYVDDPGDLKELTKKMIDETDTLF